MIPSIGLIVATYAGFRIVEILAQGKARHPSERTRIVVLILGVLAFLVIALVSLDLLLSGTSTHSLTP